MPIYLPCLLHDSFVHFHNTLSNLLIYRSKVSVEVLHILNEKYNFKTGTVIDPSSYTYDSNISFSLVSASTDIITSDIRQSLLDLSNSLLKGAVLSAGMLMTYNGMDISDLGFTSFMLY